MSTTIWSIHVSVHQIILRYIILVFFTSYLQVVLNNVDNHYYLTTTVVVVVDFDYMLSAYCIFRCDSSIVPYTVGSLCLNCRWTASLRHSCSVSNSMFPVLRLSQLNSCTVKKAGQLPEGLTQWQVCLCIHMCACVSGCVCVLWLLWVFDWIITKT